MGIRQDLITLENDRLLNLLSMYLNDAPRAVTAEDIAALAEFDLPVEEAFALTLAGVLGLDIADNETDRRLYDAYFHEMVVRCDAAAYAADPYYANIVFPTASFGNARFEKRMIAPYEGFVADDFSVTPEGRIIPPIGFFTEEFPFPTYLADERIWMSVTPNEVNTIRPAVQQAHGTVVTFGLGLGYFAYMAARKPEVDRLIAVDSNEGVIELFERHILPQFDEPGKVELVQADAFAFMERSLAATGADYVYTDLWHDVGDGLPLYRRSKGFESVLPEARWDYWIEPTLKCYI